MVDGHLEKGLSIEADPDPAVSLGAFEDIRVESLDDYAKTPS